MFDKNIFDRTERLLGEKVMSALSSSRVIIFGVGGVGSWCAEGLIRTGIGHLTIVDSDLVEASNINRQLMATCKTIGQPKVEVLKQRLLDINPLADISAFQKIYSEETAEEFNLGSYDYIIDAVDSLRHKVSLIMRACETNAVFFSSMGAALKVDPQKVKVSDFWNVTGCPLGAVLRKKIKRSGIMPKHNFLCVYGDEVLPNLGADENYNTTGATNPEWHSCKAVINGTTASVTGIFGLTLSGLVVKDIYNKILETRV